MKIAVIGTGYVGLVTGTCFAEAGNIVTCVDIDNDKINCLNGGKVPIYEPGLQVLFKRNTNKKRLHFTTNLAKGVKGAKVIFLALPTPEGEDGSADLQYVLKVASDLGPLLASYTIVVDKSTTPVGTSEKVKWTIATCSRADFDVVVNPEFLREGVAVEDFMKPDRIVVGTNSPKAKKVMKTLYAPFLKRGNPLIFMSERSAELTKYAANSYLATRISFMNEIANLSELLGCNVDDIRKGLGTDSRIGNRFLFPGIGYGGSCFPKDVRALKAMADKTGYDFKILNATMSVNEKQRNKLVQLVNSHFHGNLNGKTIAIWGLAFKPHTDDVREAPAIYNIKTFLEAGANIKVHDPEAMKNTSKLLGDKIQYFDSPYEAVDGADALLIMTEWPEFRTANFDLLQSILTGKVIFDGRNLYDIDFMQELGFTYYSIGRQIVSNHTKSNSIEFKPNQPPSSFKMAANC
jgi:UDPglucose 6-dehydrogenase